MGKTCRPRSGATQIINLFSRQKYLRESTILVTGACNNLSLLISDRDLLVKLLQVPVVLVAWRIKSQIQWTIRGTIMGELSLD